MDTRAHYLQLVAKIDAFFASVQATYRDRMQCGPGCSDCCHSRFSVTLVEAEHIAEGVASLAPEVRTRLRARARTGDPQRCAALADDGMCEIHPFRPIICRSHGAPIYCPPPALPDQAPDEPLARARAAADDGRVHLPVIEVCPKNFRSGFADVEHTLILDQNTVSTVLGALDAIFADTHDLARGTRVAIHDILAET